MSRGVNKVILLGNLGNDPDFRSTPSGTSVANISLATTMARRDQASGEWVEQTEWHRVAFFGKQADVVKQYLRKGSKIYVEGRLQTRKWQDQNGNDRWSTEVIANEMQMLDSRGQDNFSNSAPMDTGYSAPAPQQAAPQQAPQQSYAPPQQQAPAAPKTAPADDFDDDIPF